jgi:competence protein ComEC
LGGLGTLIVLDGADCGIDGRLHHAGPVVADLPGIDPGARIRGEGWLVPLGTDDFGRARRRMGAAAEFEIREVASGTVRPLAGRFAARVRTGLRAATEPLPADRSALLRGLAVGDTGGMSIAAEDSLRRAGLSHLVAVSGSNVAIVLGAIAFATRRLGLRTRLCLGALALGSFVVVVGPEPSVLRAAAMGGIALAAVGAGRRAGSLHALGLALIVVLGARPGLLYSVGLHLSAAATAGIVLWADWLLQRWARAPIVIAAPLAITVAAQVAVAPLLIVVFGELSITAPLANLLAVPAVPIATISALIAGLVAIVHAGTGALVAVAASPAAGWILAVGRHLGEPPWAAVPVSRFLGWFLGAIVVGAVVVTLRDGRARRATI